jgi:hypothetical protein
LLGFDLIGPTVEEQFGEERRGPKLRRHERAAARPGQAKALGGHGQAREPRLEANMLRGQLIDRDAVAEPGAQLRMRRGGQKAVDRIMARTNVRMRQAGNHREVIAQFGERFKIGRKRVVLPRIARKEVRRMDAEWRADADHPPRYFFLFARFEYRGQRIEQRERQGDAGGFKKRPPVRWRKLSGHS